MAGPFYVNLSSPGAWNGRDGTSSSSPWLGISGLQKAFDTVAATETCYVYGEGDLSKFYAVPFDATSGTTLTDGEAVTWHDGGGVVRVAVSTATQPGTVEIELTSGNICSDGDVITGSTSGQTITAHTTIAMKGLDVDTIVSNDDTGYIKFIGTDASWGVVGGSTRAVVDFNKHASSDHCIEFGATPYYWFQNFEAMGTAGTTKHGFYANTSGSHCHVYINCCANNNSGTGFYTTYGSYNVFFRCVSYTNGASGFSGTPGGVRYLFCCARGNTAHGWAAAGNTMVYYGCVSAQNTNDGFSNIGAVQTLLNCVSDHNADTGIEMVTSSSDVQMCIIGCRITRQHESGERGFYQASTPEPAVIGYTYFEDNTDNVSDHTSVLLQQLPYDDNTTTNINWAYATGTDTVTDTGYGYVDAATGDYSTDYTDGTDPTMRRQAITIPWS